MTTYTETFEADQDHVALDAQDFWYEGAGWYLGTSYGDGNEEYEIRGPFDSEAAAIAHSEQFPR